MQCPVCDVTLSISSREGVEIDFCPQCRGVWLDRGELDKVIERAGAVLDAAREQRPEPPRYRDERDDRSGRGGSTRKKRKHAVLDLLEDVLDL